MFMFRLKKRTQKTNRNQLLVVFFVILFCSFLYILTPPRSLNETVYVDIPEGYSIIQTAGQLKEQGVIRSEHLFRAIVQSKNKPIQKGTYRFTESHFLSTVIDRLLAADYGDVQVVITIPEGATHNQIKTIFKNSDLALDLDLLGIPEGYLFPDTYFFFRENTDADDVIDTLQQTFTEKFEQAKQGLLTTASDSDIVIMASIIEKEATNNLEEKQIIAGILWKRLSEGKRLQVDAPFLYDAGFGIVPLAGVNSQPDSPYNTYRRSGLTATAIGNPGYDSLYAAMHPQVSPYYFYLHASDGKVYYAQTYDGHLKNIRMHLR